MGKRCLAPHSAFAHIASAFAQCHQERVATSLHAVAPLVVAYEHIHPCALATIHCFVHLYTTRILPTVQQPRKEEREYSERIASKSSRSSVLQCVAKKRLGFSAEWL